MRFGAYRYRDRGSRSRGRAGRDPVAPGKRTATERLAGRRQGSVQRKQARGSRRADPRWARDVAGEGVSGAGGPLPFAREIQRSFGRHDVSDVRAHTGGAASRASDALGAEAYTHGSRVAFGRAPDLGTAAHEAAHAVQQRSGVAPAGGVSARGDPDERHADAVADAVTTGRSAEPLLDRLGGGPATAAVQRKQAAEEEASADGTGKLEELQQTGESFAFPIQFDETRQVSGIDVTFQVDAKLQISPSFSFEVSKLAFKAANEDLDRDVELAFAPGQQGLEASVGIGPFGVGCRVAGGKTFLSVSADILALMFGNQLDKLEDVLEVTSEFGAEVELTDIASPRLETVYTDLMLALGPVIETDDGEKYGSRAGAALNIESDYARGEAGDRFSQTTAVGSAFAEIYHGTGNYKVSAEGEGVATGTFAEGFAAREDIIERAVLMAFADVHPRLQEYSRATLLANAVNGSYATRYTQLADRIEATGAWIPPKEPAHDPIYDTWGNMLPSVAEGYDDAVTKATDKSREARTVHELLVQERGADVSGTYTSASWGEVSIQQDGDRLTGTFHQGSLSGRVQNVAVEYLWQQGEIKGGGYFQIMRDASRLEGRWWNADGSVTGDWILVKKD